MEGQCPKQDEEMQAENDSISEQGGSVLYAHLQGGRTPTRYERCIRRLSSIHEKSEEKVQEAGDEVLLVSEY